MHMDTIYRYFSDVETGGQTFFPNAATVTNRTVDPSVGELIQELSKSNVKAANLAEQCEAGFSVTPKKGSAILFYSQQRDGKLDARSAHAGCPVLRGQKWVSEWV